MTASLLAVPAAAADTVRFSDVADQDTAIAVETLRLMGVLDGYSDGSFRPSTQLNRAEFCKMAVYALNSESELGLYRTVTVFPDVKPSYWAAAYVNMAAKGKTIISGYPDGKFHPERPVTVGQAVTILLRMLGYKDENVGGVWPDSYMAVGATIGLADGVGTNGNASLTRGQAARLFLNLLRAEKKDGGSYLDSLGQTRPAVLASSTAGNDGKSFKTADGDVLTLASGKTSSGILDGRKGTLLLNKNGKAVTFVPDAIGSNRTVTIAACTAKTITATDGVKYTLDSTTKTYYNGEETTWANVSSWLHAGNTVTLSVDNSGTVTYVFVGGGSTSDAAVIIYENGSSVGFDAITGGMTGYSIYKNGSSAGLGDLRKYDVATYSSATNSVRVCDTRVTVYYEGCEPSPKEPSSITVLGGMKLTALPTAAESLSKFKPGDQMTLLLTEDGQVAGAVEASGNTARGNAVGIVRDGTVQFLCGTAKFLSENDVDLSAYDAAHAGTEVLCALDGRFAGQIVIDATVKPDAADSIRKLHALGLHTAMLTGDAEANAQRIAEQTGIGQVYAKLLPQDKLERLRSLRENGSVLFVGDGINDAPVLAGADVGAAMGSGADAALEAADIVFMTNSMRAIPQSIAIARATRRIAWQNVIFALIIKALVMVLGLAGIANMWMAVFADTGVAMICVLNSIRILYKKF